MKKTVGFLIVKTIALNKLLENRNWSPGVFAAKLGIATGEAYKLLSGQKVGLRTAENFVYHFKASFAHALIDWEAMGMADPYFEIKKMRIKKSTSRRQTWQNKQGVWDFPPKFKETDVWQTT